MSGASPIMQSWIVARQALAANPWAPVWRPVLAALADVAHSTARGYWGMEAAAYWTFAEWEPFHQAAERCVAAEGQIRDLLAQLQSWPAATPIPEPTVAATLQVVELLVLDVGAIDAASATMTRAFAMIPVDLVNQARDMVIAAAAAAEKLTKPSALWTLAAVGAGVLVLALVLRR